MKKQLTLHESRSHHLTRRGIAAIAAGSVIASGLLVEGARLSNPDHRSGTQIERNLSTIKHIREMQGGTVFLLAGVDLRSSMDDHNGVLGYTTSNILSTVPSGKYIALNHPGVVEKDGHKWYVTQQVGKDTSDPKAMAAATVFVDATDSLAQNPRSISISVAKDLSPVGVIPVEFTGSASAVGFADLDTHEPIAFPMTAAESNAKS